MVFDRSTWPLLAGYVLIAIAGIVFILVPPSSVSAFYIHTNVHFIELFGIIFSLGGVICASSLVARKIFKFDAVSSWYFEMSGLFLVITADVIYCISLGLRAYQTGDLNTLGLGLLFLGFFFIIVSRIIDTYKFTSKFKSNQLR